MNPTSNEPSLEKLAPELWSMISSFIPSRTTADILHLNHTSRRLYQATLLLLYREVDIDMAKHENTIAMLASDSRLAGVVRTLHVTSSRWVEKEDGKSSLLA